jgi:hypothetical protein
MTLTKECEGGQPNLAQCRPGFWRHPPAGDASDVPACTISRKVREGGDPLCGGYPEVGGVVYTLPTAAHVGAHTMRVEAPHRLLAIAG